MGTRLGTSRPRVRFAPLSRGFSPFAEPQLATPMTLGAAFFYDDEREGHSAAQSGKTARRSLGTQETHLRYGSSRKPSGDYQMEEL